MDQEKEEAPSQACCPLPDPEAPLPAPKDPGGGGGGRLQGAALLSPPVHPRGPEIGRAHV